MPKSSSRESESNEDFFNNPPENDHDSIDADGDGEVEAEADTTAPPRTDGHHGEDYVPRPKRIACILCRKRKLRCDGKKPSCGTCSRLGHDCAYDEVRKKSGPKRGYVKLLEQRLKQVEDLLETRDTPDMATRKASMGGETAKQPQNTNSINVDNMFTENSVTDPAFVDPTISSMMPDFGNDDLPDFSWEMIGMGLEEPLPTQDVIDDMNQIYFEKVHPSLPMIHKPRYYAAMNLAPHMRPPVALRYAMWMNACSVTPRYNALIDHFYARARKYLEMDEMKGHGESMITLAHAQAWTLIACFEFKLMYFPRAWLSCGRANRLAQMMGLHRQDGVGLDVKQTLLPPRDWTEREERRRTFWMIFCQDRYASIGTGWPMTIDEQDIMTNLPASEEAFHTSKAEPTLPLAEALTGDGASTLSSFGGVILMACLFGRNLTHLHRPNAEEKDHDLNGEFWKRHRMLDNILLNISLSLPSHLRLPDGLHNANIIFCNMNIHTSTICLHQAAIFKADKNKMPAQISAESKRRCIIAADQITTIMKMASHVDLATLNPFISFCLYVAARVFVQYLKSRRTDQTVRSSLQFLLQAMAALKSKNPLTESFLVQLEVDLEGSGLDIKIPPSTFTNSLAKEMSLNMDSVKCSPLFEISQTQAPGYNGMPPNSSPNQNRQPPATSNSDFNLNAYTSIPSNLPQRSKQPLHSVDLFNNSTDWEMDTSPDGSGATRMSSGLPTPSSASHKASSNTSFSPQAQNLGISPGNFTDSNSPNPQQPTNFSNFNNNNTTTNDSVFSTTNNQIFPMPTSWEFPNHSAANPIPNPIGRTGLTPQPHPENLHASPQGPGQRVQQQQYGTGAGGSGVVNENDGTPWNEPDWDGVQSLADMGMGLGDLGGLGGLGPGLGSTNWDGSGQGGFGMGMGSAEWNAHLNSG